MLDFEIDSERLQVYGLFFIGVILGYLAILGAIELELYYYQSRFVVAKLYGMILDAEKADQFRSANSRVDLYATSSMSASEPQPVATQSR